MIIGSMSYSQLVPHSTTAASSVPQSEGGGGAQHQFSPIIEGNVQTIRFAPPQLFLDDGQSCLNRLGSLLNSRHSDGLSKEGQAPNIANQYQVVKTKACPFMT